MKINMMNLVFALISMVVVSACNSDENYKDTEESPTTTFNCSADENWFTQPSMPTEVKKSEGGKSSNFCDFYQFSWQTFAYLMATSKTNPAIHNFEDASQFAILEMNSDGSAADSCDQSVGNNTLFIRTSKPTEAGTEFVIPERINQAGSRSTIYDQAGNVVYYNVRFSIGMCDTDSIQQAHNFPGGTTELKTAWKVLSSSDDPSQFITMDAKIEQNKTASLGMVGMHIAVATPDHPEFIWATFEHNSNVPNCQNPSPTTGWSFTSETCATELLQRDVLGVVQCRFNTPKVQNDLSKTTGQSPTEICREYPYGSHKDDLKYTENVEDIISLNSNVQPYLTESYAVLKNYFNLGALWVSDIKQNSALANQRGSLRLANSVAETDFQDVNLDAGFVSNCFGCHNYVGTSFPASGKNTTSGSLSHIFDDIIIGSKKCMDVQSKTIINNESEAENACSSACTSSSKHLEWNGQWSNQNAGSGEQLPMTVCGCCGAKPSM